MEPFVLALMAINNFATDGRIEAIISGRHLALPGLIVGGKGSNSQANSKARSSKRSKRQTESINKLDHRMIAWLFGVV